MEVELQQLIPFKMKESTPPVSQEELDKLKEERDWYKRELEFCEKVAAFTPKEVEEQKKVGLSDDEAVVAKKLMMTHQDYAKFKR